MFSITDKEQISSLLAASEAFANPRFTLSGTLRKNFDSLILSDLWPLEVPESLIVTTPDQARLRARSIVHFYGLHTMKDKKFLDFGCGAGECVAEAARAGVKAFGFDPRKQWSDDAEGTFSTDIKEINAHGPFDVIALYDVIDHTSSREKALEALRRAAVVSSRETVVRVRCHPYTSRHGGHLYESINKAYAHILLSEETLAKHLKEPVRKVKKPMGEYRALFDEAGFKLESTNKTLTPLEPLFRTPQMVEIFRMHLDGDKEWQEAVLPIAFVDFVLKLK
jgi:2-polyprenyl-3-methyl-5-hydroxy-6-metoxy-1,4-benzoquinol methylase